MSLKDILLFHSQQKQVDYKGMNGIGKILKESEVTSMVSTSNITTVRNEDRQFIQDISKLTADKKALVKGIVIGLQLEDAKNKETAKKKEGN